MSDDIGGVWRTIGGRRVFIKDGEDLETAMKNSGKFGNDKTNLKDSYENLEKVADKFEYKKFQSFEKEYQEVVEDFYKEIGYDAKPKITNEIELERVARATKYGLLERGYRGEDKEKIQDYINQFKKGDLYIGSQRAFGSGTYFGYGQEAHSIAHRYGQQDNDNILKATIANNSKVISSQQLNTKREKFMNKAFEKASEINKTEGSEAANKYYKKMNYITMDDGVFAASLGYDAIDVEDAKYLVVLNRGKVLVSE